MTTTNAESALEILGVSKTFKSEAFKEGQVVVQGLTAAFPKGRCTGLLGPNGAGKTTTIRMVLGLIAPDSGSIRVFGAPLDRKARRRIGYMAETDKLPGALTPEEALMHHLALYQPPAYATKAARRARVDALLKEVGLAQHAKKRIAKLSKGMARRLAWALAIAHDPDLLILDEPSSGLDPLGRREMLRWIEGAKARGASIVLCTHDLVQVHALCDDFHILNKGHLVLSTRTEHAEGPRAGAVLPEWRHAYNIHVSGTDEATLRRLGQEANLLPWQGFKQEGYLAILGFAEYPHASTWLAELLARGMVVVRFGDQTDMGEEELLPYFQEEPIH